MSSSLSLPLARTRTTSPLGGSGASAVFNGNVGEAVCVVVGALVGLVVEGDGVAAGVGPDDADGGDAGLEIVGDVEFAQGEVLLGGGVEVVGGEDALAAGDEGQSVAGVEGWQGAAVLVALVG